MGDFTVKDTLTVATGAALGLLLGPASAPFLSAAAGAGTATAVIGTRKAAGAREVELELAQRKETQASQDREVQRKRRLAALLGSQSAEAAARGLELSGSVANISLTDATRAGEESLIDNVNTRARIDALKRNRKTISSVSNLRSATTILGGAERVASRG